ncbi:MAG: hypothetical protein IKT77_01110 [Paludibacteraceae bacterium]|nr:hypothetical protein [Paludibacteraceae bacterium]
MIIAFFAIRLKTVGSFGIVQAELDSALTYRKNRSTDNTDYLRHFISN